MSRKISTKFTRPANTVRVIPTLSNSSLRPSNSILSDYENLDSVDALSTLSEQRISSIPGFVGEVDYTGDTTALSGTYSSGVLTLTVEANKIVTGFSVRADETMFVHNDGNTIADGFKIIVDNSANSTTAHNSKSPQTYQFSDGVISASNPLAYDSNLLVGHIIDTRGAGIIGYAFDDLLNRAGNGVLISF